MVFAIKAEIVDRQVRTFASACNGYFADRQSKGSNGLS